MEDKTPKIVFVGTFPPTEEGIATFTEDLVNSVSMMAGKEALCKIVAINLKDTSPFYFNPNVISEIDQESLRTYKNAAKNINADRSIKAVVVQHEYGLFGGEWGEHIVDFMRLVEKPILVTMHTVLETHPFKTEKFRQVTDDIVKYASAIVVLSKKSKKTLVNEYPMASSKVFYIPHGIHPVRFVQTAAIKRELGLGSKTVLTTFGLLSKDKGIEYVIRALPAVIAKYPNAIYQVLGRTHPIIRKREGESYRTELISMVKKLKLRKNVIFVDKYMTLHELLKYLQGTDIYIATSTNKDQAVSGTFSYALGAGRPVISTNFVQAQEMITKEVGRTVPIRDSKAYTDAICELLADKEKLTQLNRKAYTKTRSMLWSNIGRQYLNVIEDLIDAEKINFGLPRVDLSYLKKMTRDKGLLQFAKYDIPSEEFGFTVDDNARALIVINWLLTDNGYEKSLLRLQQKYLNFIRKSVNSEGNLVNYFDINLNPTHLNTRELPKEHYGRALWALAETLGSPVTNKIVKTKTRKLFESQFKYIDEVHEHLRPRALFIKALSTAIENDITKDLLHKKIIKLADRLVEAFEKNSIKGWRWFEDKLSYNNAVLPESLALAYKATKIKKYLKVAKKAFGFLISKTFMGDIYVPIGHKRWYIKGNRRSYYDQQPEDTSASVLGLITMYEITNNKKYLKLAKNAFTWFLGNNLNCMPLVNNKTGGVYDGLTEEGVNKNQGAESLVSYLLARVRLEKYYAVKT